MEALNQLVKDPGNWFFTVGVAAILGVWWARLTPNESNATLVIGVLAVGIAIFFKTSGLLLPLRVLWIGTIVCPLTLFVYYEMWTPRAETLEAKRNLLTAVENRAYRDLVVEVIHAFEPNAYMSVGGAVLGPDGARTVDIQVWPSSGAVRGPTIIDVIDHPDGQPVGVEVIDSADSKRRDVRANAMLLCSNTGFDALAVRKAKRANIGLISALKHGDQRVRGRIEEEVYLRKVKVSPFTIEYEGSTADETEILRRYLTSTHDVTYTGGSVAKWLQERVMMIIMAHPKEEKPLKARFEFKSLTQFSVRGHQVVLRAVTIHFQPKVQWLSQTVTLDAKNGIYDYVRGRVKLSGGANSYVIGGVDFDKAKPISSPPEAPVPGVGLQRGEIDVSLMMVEGLDMPDGTQVAKLDDLVRPEDLSLAITGSN